jgi:hypothetical protein
MVFLAHRLVAGMIIFTFVFTDIGPLLQFPPALPEVPQAEAAFVPAIKVESFDQDVTTDGSTFTLTNDVTSTSSAFVRMNTGTRKSSAGPTGSTANTGPNVGTVGLVLTDTNEITVERVDATAVKVLGEVWRYVGPVGGDHEFIVRDRAAVSLSGSSASVAVSGVSNADNVVPFITGYTVNDTSVSNWEYATIAAHLDDSGNLVVSRNNSGTTATVYVDVVEFTGSAWTVCHGYSNSHDTTQQTITLNTDSDGQGGSTCDVTDWSTATIIEATMEGDTGETGLSDTLALVRPGANTTSVVFDVQQDGNARNDGEAWIHVLQNDGLVVNRTANANIAEGNGSYGTAIWPSGATTTAALDTLSLEWFTDTSGVGTAHMRGGLHARITDASGTIEHWIHRSGNNVGVEYGVIELAGLTFDNTFFGFDTLVIATSTQIAATDIPSTDVYVGGAFVIQEGSATRNVTGITISEAGTIDGANGLSNVELWYDVSTTTPYDCREHSYDGNETQFGSTDTNGFSGADGSASFTDIVEITTAKSLCVYPVMSVTESATDGETIDITVNNPSVDVIVTGGGSVGPVTTQSIAGSTTVQNAELTQIHYHWLNDDGVEGAATSVEGSEDTPTGGFAAGTTRRLRMQVSAEGATSSAATAFRLEYAEQAASCALATGWSDVGAVGGAWDMSDSTFITNGADSSDLAPAAGGTTNENTTFLSTNGALRDTSSQTGSLTFTSSNFLELEFAIEPTGSAVEGTTYCFRLSDAGTPLRNYDIYPEGTVSADITVSALGSHVASTDVGTDDVHLGGSFVISRTGAARTMTSLMITETGTVDATTLTNPRFFYDLDTTAPYDCNSESYAITDSSVSGSAFAVANGTTTFNTSLTASTTQTICGYVVVDVGTSTTDGDTIEVSVADPSADVVVTSSTVGPSSSIGPTASTTIAGPVLTQHHYHWRNDDGGETDATSATAGAEDTPIGAVPKESPQRLRLGVSNEGSVTAASTSFRLEYGTKVTTCEAVSTWNEVGIPAGAWQMAASTFISDGNTTDIASTTGGITNESGSFVGTGALRETSPNSGSLTLTSTQFTELEYNIEATADAGDGVTYCFRVSAAGTALPSYTNYPELTLREKQDFFVQRGTEQMSGTSLTLTAGVDYTAPASNTAAFVRITNSKHTGAGNNTGGGNQNADDVTVYLSDQSDLTSSFTLSRPSTAGASTRVSWELVEFVGLPGTDNEMIVRDTGTTSLSAATFTAAGATVSGVADDADVVVFITGQRNNNTTTGQYNDGNHTAAWNATTSQPEFTRGDADVLSEVSYAVVEFTGANWQVQRVENVYEGAGSTETVSITPIPNVTQAFIHAQKRIGTGLNGLDEMGHQVWLSSLGAVSFQLRSGADTPSSHYSVAWVIANTQTGDGALRSYQSSGTIATGGPEPNLVSIPIGLGVGETLAIENASIFATNDSTGGGTAYPRGLYGYAIASSTHYELFQSDTGQNTDYRVEVVRWPVADTSLRQNYYRFYVDNDALDPIDPWPVGATDLGENTSITGADDPLGEGERVRIRMSLRVNNATLPASVEAFKLQYGLRTTSCSAISVWTDVGAPGSGAIWRGFDGTVVDGTELATSTPAFGTLNLSVSDVAGTYEEVNNTAVNPYAVDIGEDVEYDWHVEHNGAAQRSDYCFRMVKSDDTPLVAYDNYPTLRTTGFTPIVDGWRWYDDETNLTPASPLAAEDVAPIDIANQNILKLRTVLSEVEGAPAVNQKFYLQYSEYADFRDGGTLVTATTTCAATSTWCYADGAGTDNATLAEALITTADSCTGGSGAGCGSYNEAATTTGTVSHPSFGSVEYEYTIQSAGPRTNAVYYFRLVDAATEDVVAASSSYPSVVTEGASLVFSASGLPVGTSTEGVVTDIPTTPSTISFGALAFDTEYEGAQRLSVTTNATEGYQVLMYARQGLQNSYGTDIAGIAHTNQSPGSWATGCLPAADGCFGYHAGDDTLSGTSTRFAPVDSYAALATTPYEVMYSSIPSDDTSDVVYRVQVTDSQPAGQYETDIVYLAIPVF